MLRTDKGEGGGRVEEGGGGGRKPECPEKTTDDELQTMPHAKAQNFNPKLRLEPAL